MVSFELVEEVSALIDEIKSVEFADVEASDEEEMNENEFKLEIDKDQDQHERES